MHGAAKLRAGIRTVRKITRSYEVRGMLEKVSAFDTGSTPLKEVQFASNDFSQPAEREDHDVRVRRALAAGEGDERTRAHYDVDS